MNWNPDFAARTAQMKRSTVRETLKLAAQPGMISFAGGLPAPELFPLADVRRAMETVLRERGAAALQYGETEGVAELRDWIAREFSRPHFQLTRDNVAIVSGGQQALDLIGRVFLNEGDTVIVENPTYLALLAAWRPLGVRFVTVPSDAGGMCVEALAPLLRPRPKLIYTTPTFQNPQGTTLTAERRKELVALLREHEIGLVEDNPYGELRYSGEPLPHLLELDARTGADGRLDTHVIYAGTFSKVLAPGLRIGWVIADDTVIDKLVLAKQAADLHTSTLNQHLVCELLRDGTLTRQLPLLRDAYRARRDTMLAALDKHFPAAVTWTRPDGGLFLMVTLPEKLNAFDLLRRAVERKVAFVPGEDFHLNGAGRNTFRLNFSNASQEQITEGVQRLGEALREMLKQ